MNWLKCREVLERETMHRDSGTKPGWIEWAGIVFHMALCRTCRVYMRQVASIQAIVHRMAGRGTDPAASLSEDRKARMREQLEKEAMACGCHSGIPSRPSPAPDEARDRSPESTNS